MDIVLPHLLGCGGHVSLHNIVSVTRGKLRRSKIKRIVDMVYVDHSKWSSIAGGDIQEALRLKTTSMLN